MTTPSEFDRMAERVEAATGPDRELDAEVCCVVGPLVDPKYVSYARPSENRVGMVIRYFNDGGHGTCVSPNFTSSLDAAMTLAEGTGKSVPQLLGEAMRQISCLPMLISHMSASEYAQTLARFFTAACLHAAASKARADGGKE